MAEATTTNNFRQRLAARMFDESPLPKVAYMAFGDGGHSGSTAKVADPARTTLYNERLRKPLASILQEDLYSVTGVGSLAKEDLVGVSVSEAALLDSSGNMLGFRNFAPKIKDADEAYNITIKLKF